jgi:hypothetical protein
MQRFDYRPGYRTRQYGSNRRWLIKALREVARSIGRTVEGMRGADLRRRTDADEWSIVELVGYLRDSEREDLASVRSLIRRDGARIDERRAYLGPIEQDYRAEDADQLLWEFADLRDETIWLLRDGGDAWEHVGEHPYRGLVPLGRLVHEMTERDLDVMWRIERVRDARNR